MTITVTVDEKFGPAFTWQRTYSPEQMGELWEAAATSTTTHYIMREAS